MNAVPNIAEVAALIADSSRTTILFSLMDGRMLPASELARRAKISPQTASAHLAKLVNGKLLDVETNGRYRYYKLANAEVAHVLEGMISIAPVKKITSLRESEQVKALKYARTCYDHLAGLAGVKLTQCMLDNGIILPVEKDFTVTKQGEDFFVRFGIDIQVLKKSKRVFARQCLDWSERMHHCSGILGAAITRQLFDLGWIKRVPDTRAVQVTREGYSGLYHTFGMKLEDKIAHFDTQRTF
ncbi:metalloregulator ArsR/SmtB family transcription factor [Aneurinibacillus sp. Ricciae_BoGa-3]|uniref:ArsR/SmtB family transcription factor n=1 Tax=Aneurinibacillus sp. Ricciae_BoGa-3 TaxID=3022697 RepID=UPI002340F4FC|nr:metalloregulator ArsR/SmtB family transcription factor [Aneurinibacillus sp. Ricciae_BoGa-3]WCK54099.1 metalloregulator ArsR/SmtB family transcription factor [Aneurinibacillus sp. Ricciae_BoGa-3]